MKETISIAVMGRRTFVLGASAGAAVLSILGTLPSMAQAQLGTIEEALKSVLKDAKPEETGITLELPEIAENGNTVPFTVSVTSPMTPESHVKALHIFAAGNPQVGVASYSFSPDAGRAAVSSRMRLAKTQDIYAVAELSDGKFLMGKRTVKVTIGGCGG